MGAVNPISGNFNINAGSVQLVYSCPNNKSHAIIDLSMYKDNDNDALIQIALSTGGVGSLTSVDYFLDDIEMIGVNRNAELTKVVVGPNENLYVKVVSGNSNVRISGIEETNTKVGLAGRLSAGNVAAADTQTSIYSNAVVGASYIAASITLYNSHSTNDSTVEVWVTDDVSPATEDKTLEVTVLADDTLVIENIVLKENEKIFVRGSQANMEYFINGFVVL